MLIATMAQTQIHEHVMQIVYEVVKAVQGDTIGVAFSGGIDSSLLAKICKDVKKDVSLLTIGFPNNKDIRWSHKLSNVFGLLLFYDFISYDELESGLITVIPMIDFTRMVRLELCLGFYFVFKLASKHGLNMVLSANGIDELFCGYNVYKSLFGDTSTMVTQMQRLVDIGIKDKKEIDKIAQFFGITFSCPFLTQSFIDFAITLPWEFKIKTKDDNIRKHILREVALIVGVPEDAAMRSKKAFQYSSGLHQAIKKLAKQRGFTKRSAQMAGFSSALEAYLTSLSGKI